MKNTFLNIFRISLFVLLFAQGANAQVADEVGEPEILLKKQMTGSAHIHNLGWGFGLRKGNFKSVSRDQIWEFDFAKMKHPKAVKIANPNYSRPPSYVYGKTHEMYLFRFGYGTQNLLFNKGEKNGVEIRYHLSAGSSNALLKPIWLLILDADNPFDDDPVPMRYEPTSHFNENIFGLADFSYGLNELKFRPGAYGKASLIFEWGEYYQDLRTIEVGATVDVYPSRLPLMAFIENKSTFVSFYIALSFGKRW